MTLIPEKVAAVLDGPKYINDWRRFFHFPSVRWSLGGFALAVSQSAALAASPLAFEDIAGKLAVSIVVAFVFLGSMYARLLAPKHDDTNDAGA